MYTCIIKIKIHTKCKTTHYTLFKYTLNTHFQNTLSKSSRPDLKEGDFVSLFSITIATLTRLKKEQPKNINKHRNTILSSIKVVKKRERERKKKEDVADISTRKIRF